MHERAERLAGRLVSLDCDLEREFEARVSDCSTLAFRVPALEGASGALPELGGRLQAAQSLIVATEPLSATQSATRFDVQVNVCGGGPSGQAGAVRHGIARALVSADASLRPTLRAQGFLTRDPRMKERKKYGQPGARKRFQFSKR